MMRHSQPHKEALPDCGPPPFWSLMGKKATSLPFGCLFREVRAAFMQIALLSHNC